MEYKMSEEKTKSVWTGESPIYEALAKFQKLNISATKDGNNPYFSSKYATLDSVINAVNHGAEFGLSFSQTVNYDWLRLEREVTVSNNEGATKTTKGAELVRDIYVVTTIYHHQDEKTLVGRVPVLVNANDKDNPQKLGSSISYAKRYGLQALYGLGSDDDANEASKNDKGEVPNAKTPNGKVSTKKEQVYTPPQPPKDEIVSEEEFADDDQFQ